MNNNKLVSLIIPVYNNKFFLNKCIESVLNQTYKNIEVILINDGSSDGSGHICDVYAEKDKRIKVIHQENQGVSVARNKGLDKASGTFIQFVDSDDYIEDKMTEILVTEMNENIDVTMCGYKSIHRDKDGKIRSTNSNVYKESHISKESFSKKFGIYFKDMFINFIWNKLYRVDIIKNNNVYFDSDIGWGEDLIFNLDYLEHCNNISIIKDSLYSYVEYNDASITTTFNENKYKDREIMYEKIRIFLNKNNAYNGENKDIVEIKYINSIISTMNQWFQASVDYTDSEIRYKMNKVVSNKRIHKSRLYFDKLGFQSKFVGIMIQGKQVSFLIFYFRIKNWVKVKMSPLFEVLYKFNKYTKKNENKD